MVVSRSKKREELWGQCLSEHLVTGTLTIVWLSGTLIFTQSLGIGSACVLSGPRAHPGIPQCAHSTGTGAPPVLWLRVASLLDAVQSLVPCDCSRESLTRPCGRREASQSRGGPAEPLLCSLLPESAVTFAGGHLLSAPHSSLSSQRGMALLSATPGLTPRGRVPLVLALRRLPCPCSRAALLTHCGGARRLLSSP